jgi:hypothetical protein
MRALYRRAARVRAALRAAADRPAFPFVRAAFFAAVERLAALLDRALLRACFESALAVPADRPSRLSAPLTARDRLAEGLPRAFVRRAWLFPAAFFCLGTFTPARRAFDSPIAIACRAERAPCFPSRT